MFSRYKLGLNLPDPRRVAAVPNLSAGLHGDPLLSETPRDWALGRPWDDDVLGNDVLGDCGPAAAVNVLKLVADVAGYPSAFTSSDALDAYRRMGWDGTEATDNGVVLCDLMSMWQREGIGGIKLDMVCRVGYLEPKHLATAVAIGGPLIVGVELTNACKSTDRWDAAAADDAGVWGYHAIMVYAFSPGLIRAKSWGQPVDITQEFLTRRCREAYLPVCESMRVPSGASYQRLLEIVRSL